MKLIKLIFTAIGILLLVISGFLFEGKMSFISNSKTVNGEVVGIESSTSRDSNGHYKTYYAPRIEYQLPDGRFAEFVSSVESTSCSYREGMPVKVLYDPKNPSSAEIDSVFTLWFGLFIAFILGIAFFAVGMGLIIVPKMIGRRDERLKKSGMCVEAKCTGIEINESVSMNGKSPYRIVAQWKDPVTNKVHVINSHNIWFDPSDYVKVDQPIKVYVDPANHKKYFMETGFLPKKA